MSRENKYSFPAAEMLPENRSDCRLLGGVHVVGPYCSSCSLIRSRKDSLRLSPFCKPIFARIFARWLVMLPLLLCSSSHIWLTVLSCRIRRQMDNSEGESSGYIFLMISSLLFSSLRWTSRAVKSVFLAFSPIIPSNKFTFSAGLSLLISWAKANNSSLFI